jgi:uncharacterized membrane protein
MSNRYTSRDALITLLQHQAIERNNIKHAIKRLGILATPLDWRRFFDQLMLWLGGLSLAFALLFFIAYNWQAIDHLFKFILLEVSLITALGIYALLERQSVGARVALVSGAILVGVLLALFGQTYQTGADPWELFFYWSLLIFPWVIIGRSVVLWLLWIALINLSMVLYYQTFFRHWIGIFHANEMLLWTLFVVNFLIGTAWEGVAWYRHQRDHTSWVVRILAIATTIPLTTLTSMSIIDHHAPLALLVWTLFITTLYLLYRQVKHDLFILAIGSLSLMSITLIALSVHILFKIHNASALLLLALALIAIGSTLALWLKRLHKEWQS